MPKKKPKKSKYLFEPLFEKQGLFLSSTADECLGGGARGGGKSVCLSIDAAFKPREYHYDKNGKFIVDKVSIDYPEYTAIIIRRSYRDLEVNFKPFTDLYYANDIYKGKWVERRKCYEFPSGAKIYIVHCDNIRDVNKYVGGNYHYLGIEEVNQFPQLWIDLLKGSVRSKNPHLLPYKRYTSNPGNIGHIWLKKYFVDKCTPVIDGEKTLRVKHHKIDITWKHQMPAPAYEDELGMTREYIPFGALDNPFYTNGQDGYVYLKNLMSMPEAIREMWLLGQWDNQVGEFIQWNSAFHIASDFKLDLSRMTVYRCVDYGTAAPFVCLFVSVDEDGEVVVFDELYQRGLSATKQAVSIVSKTLALGLDEDKVELTVADPSYWNRNTELDKELTSPASIYFENGIRKMFKGNNNRIAGAILFQEFFDIPDVGLPRCRVTPNCLNVIEHFPQLIRDERRPEDVNTDGEDHEYDALRYLLMWVQASMPKRKKKDRDWKDRMKEENIPEKKVFDENESLCWVC